MPVARLCQHFLYSNTRVGKSWCCHKPVGEFWARLKPCWKVCGLVWFGLPRKFLVALKTLTNLTSASKHGLCSQYSLFHHGGYIIYYLVLTGFVRSTGLALAAIHPGLRRRSKGKTRKTKENQRYRPPPGRRGGDSKGRQRKAKKSKEKTPWLAPCGGRPGVTLSGPAFIIICLV